MKLLQTISYSQDYILDAIQKLYTGSFDYDSTYGKGNFYKEISEPKYRSDRYPQYPYVMGVDTRNIPFKDESLMSVVFDPPFVVGPSDSPGIMRDMYGCFKNVPQLWEYYRDSILEFYRILKPEGFLVVKCQDVVSGGKNWFSHVYIMNIAYEIGFYPRDLFVLLAKNRVNSPNMVNQQHARKHHSFFWVFEKITSKVIYNIEV